MGWSGIRRLPGTRTSQPGRRFRKSAQSLFLRNTTFKEGLVRKRLVILPRYAMMITEPANPEQEAKPKRRKTRKPMPKRWLGRLARAPRALRPRRFLFSTRGPAGNVPPSAHGFAHCMPSLPLDASRPQRAVNWRRPQYAVNMKGLPRQILDPLGRLEPEWIRT